MFGACGSGTILVLPGTIMVLVTAGAPPFCRAEYEGWRSVRVAVVRFSYLLAILLFVGGGSIVFFGSILVLPGIIMVMVTTGAPPFCCSGLMVALQSSYPRA